MTYKVSNNGSLTIETHRSGHFRFEIGLDFDELATLTQLVEHAYARFASMPMVADIANQLEKLSLVTSVYGTNTIEGGTLTEDETALAIDLDPESVKEEEQQRVINLKNAYDFVEYVCSINAQHIPSHLPGNIHILIKKNMLTDLHKRITKNLKHDDNIPGKYRDNPKARKTQVGTVRHGGIYTPPKCLDDIAMLVDAFISWANSEAVLSLPPLYRAPLLHYYFELIHPFWDGNGRTGRVIEALILQAANYKYAPYANAKYYLENIDAYFTLFNSCRKMAVKNKANPNTEFVKFHLKATLTSINRLHDTANKMIARVVFDSQLNLLYTTKKINDRQFQIMSYLSANPDIGLAGQLSKSHWYQSLYKKLTVRTKIRDMNKLIELGLVSKEKQSGDIKIKFANPELKLQDLKSISIEYFD